MADIKDLDLYGLLELTIDCTEQDIRSAYRKKALKCHPDKNPDDKEAIKTFHLLSKALEVLLDKSARAAYDSVIRRKEEVKIRNSKLDTTRKRFKEDLERREKEAEIERHRGYKVNKTDEEILQGEIDRLRKEGSVRLQEEIKLMTEELKAAQELNNLNAKQNPENYRLRIKWKSTNGTLQDGINNLLEYNKDSLTKIFSKYGKINILVISAKKQGSALLEFEDVDSARRAKLYEVGYPGHPLQLSYLNPEVERSEAKNQSASNVFVNNIDSSANGTARVDNDFSRVSNTEDGASTKMSNIFPCANISSSIFPSGSNIFPSTNKSSRLFPAASESSNIFSSASKSRNIFPSGLFPSAANVTSSVFENSSRSRNLVLNSKKNSEDLDYEEAVLNQMRKAQGKQ